MEELERVAEAAGAFAAPGEQLVAVLPTEPVSGALIFLCAFDVAEGGRRNWLALDASGEPVASRAALREAVAIAALCELAEEVAAGGDLDELRSRLVGLRLTENPPGIDEAEEAVLELQQTVGVPPHVASPERLEAVGAATRRLEEALGEHGVSPFAEAMKQGMGAIESLTEEVERAYKRHLAP